MFIVMLSFLRALQIVDAFDRNLVLIVHLPKQESTPA